MKWNLKKLANWMFELATLKLIKRSGWSLALERDVENVAEHTGGSVQIAVILAIMAGADPGRVAIMDAFHDMPESRTGDPNKVNARYFDKDQAEANALSDQLAPIDPLIADPIKALIDEFNAGETLDAQVAKDAEILQMVICACQIVAKGNVLAKDWITRSYNRLKTESARQLFRVLVKTSPIAWWYENDLKKM